MSIDPTTILDAPDLFFKTQREAEEKSPAGTGAELIPDLEMNAAIVNRAQRRLTAAAAAELDSQQGKAARYQIERIQKQLRRIAETIPLQKELHADASLWIYPRIYLIPGSALVRRH